MEGSSSRGATRRLEVIACIILTAILCTGAQGSQYYPINYAGDWQCTLLDGGVAAWQAAFEDPQRVDWGDAPEPAYETLSANSGASHPISPNLFLGSSVDAESDGQPHSAALGDDNAGTPDDEDGVVFNTPLIPGQSATITVTASAPCILDAWIDFSGINSWSEPGEQVFTSIPLAAGANTLTFAVPATVTPGTKTFARFRCSSTGGLSYKGPARDGEVEDYEVSIGFKWTQPPDLETTGIDVNASRNFILADDFLCTLTGPITDIHLWGSWYQDVLPEKGPNDVKFTLSIHKDIPASVSPTGYSMPGDVLWIGEFQPGEFTARPYAQQINEGWMTPPDQYQFPGDHVCWQYDFVIKGDQFIQRGSLQEPVVYWLDVQAEPIGGEARFGWKTSTKHWNDAGVWGTGSEPYLGPWKRLIYPDGHQFGGKQIDLAFAITGNAIRTGAMSVHYNATIPDHFWRPNTLDPHNEMLSLKVVADPVEPVKWTGITLEASGTGNDASDIAAVRVWQDVNNNAVVDAADLSISTGVYPADNGTLTLVFAAPPTVPAGGVLSALVSYTMNTAPAPLPGTTFGVQATAATGVGQISGIPVPVTLSPNPLVGAKKIVARKPITIGEAKLLKPLTPFYLEDKEITASFTSPDWPAPWQWIYIEETDRSSGIGVIVSRENPFHVGDRVSLQGVAVLVNGAELMVEPEYLFTTYHEPTVTPLGMNNKFSGGGVFGGQPAVVDIQPQLLPIVPKWSAGLNSVGSLIRTWGRVTGYGGVTLDASGNMVDVFWIDDGSNLRDGYWTMFQDPSQGIAVVTPRGITVDPTGYWSVTGILKAIRNPFGNPVRLLVPRDFENDMTPYIQPQ